MKLKWKRRDDHGRYWTHCKTFEVSPVFRAGWDLYLRRKDGHPCSYFVGNYYTLRDAKHVAGLATDLGALEVSLPWNATNATWSHGTKLAGGGE